MALVRFPPGEPVFTGRAFEDGVFAEVDALLADGYCPDGRLDIETAELRLTCLMHLGKPHLAGLTDAGGFGWVPLAELPLRARQLEGAVCSLVHSDPIRVLMQAVHFRNRPVLQATTDLIDLTHVLRVLATAGQDAALALERDGERSLMFLQKGVPTRLYFGSPARAPDEGTIEERFLLYAFAPGAPVGKLEVFKQLAIEPDPDAGRPLAVLNREAQPPPPTVLQVRLGGRLVQQRPFIAPQMVIGRDCGCALSLDNLSVSRQHAQLLWSRGGFVLEDLASANGTFVNGKRIAQRQLVFGDRIGIGKFEIALTGLNATAHPDATLAVASGTAFGGEGDGLYLVGEGRSVEVGELLTIGKTRGVDVRARGFRVKPLHARVRRERPGVYTLECLGTASARLNGQPVQNACLQPGDELAIGRSRFRFVQHLNAEPTGA